MITEWDPSLHTGKKIRCPGMGTLLRKALVLLDGSLRSTALRQQHSSPFSQQSSLRHSWRGLWSPAVLHSSEYGLCTAVDLQEHPYLRGLSEDNKLTTWSVQVWQPSLPWALSNAQDVTCYFWQEEKKISVVLRFWVFFCTFAKNKQNSFHWTQ